MRKIGKSRIWYRRKMLEGNFEKEIVISQGTHYRNPNQKVSRKYDVEYYPEGGDPEWVEDNYGEGRANTTHRSRRDAREEADYRHMVHGYTGVNSHIVDTTQGKSLKKGVLVAKIPDDLSQEITSWTKSNVWPEHLGSGGQEFSPHVTLKYGLNSDIDDELRSYLLRHGPITLTLGDDLSLFEDNENGDVLKVDVNSPELEELNKLVSSNYECEDSHSDYHPHMTLAYVNPAWSRGYMRHRPSFLGKEVKIKEIEFSKPDGTKELISLSHGFGKKEMRIVPITHPDNSNEPTGTYGVVHSAETPQEEEAGLGKIGSYSRPKLEYSSPQAARRQADKTAARYRREGHQVHIEDPYEEKSINSGSGRQVDPNNPSDYQVHDRVRAIGGSWYDHHRDQPAGIVYIDNTDSVRPYCLQFEGDNTNGWGRPDEIEHDTVPEGPQQKSAMSWLDNSSGGALVGYNPNKFKKSRRKSINSGSGRQVDPNNPSDYQEGDWVTFTGNRPYIQGRLGTVLTLPNPTNPLHTIECTDGRIIRARIGDFEHHTIPEGPQEKSLPRVASRPKHSQRPSPRPVPVSNAPSIRKGRTRFYQKPTQQPIQEIIREPELFTKTKQQYNLENIHETWHSVHPHEQNKAARQSRE